MTGTETVIILLTAPKLVDGNTMVPAEFYRDNFGVSVIWDDVTSSLFINSGYI